MTRYKVGTPHRRKKTMVEVNCAFCGEKFKVVQSIAKDFVCGSCKEHFRREMEEPWQGRSVKWDAVD